MRNPLAGNTFLTRNDQVQAVRHTIEALLPSFSPGGARVDLGPRGTSFSADAAQLEGFARPLWAVAALAVNGDEFAHWDLYRRGLAAGVDPEHDEYWGGYDTADQRMVEQAAIGWALAVAPHELWEPLPDRSRQQLVDWLQLVNVVEPFGNNWQFFRILVNLGLARVGVDFDSGAQERSLAAIHDLYLGDGWYKDGPLRTCDLYVPCAFHFYGLLYAAQCQDEHAALFRERAREFAPQWAAWFDADGNVVPFGRSLTYRFVAAAFWAGLAIADEQALPWGEVKGLLQRHLRAWGSRPIWRNDGTLSIGYGYANEAVGEEYISSASPYWAMKSFAALAAPPSHRLWSAEEVAPDNSASTLPQPHPGMLIARSPHHVVALSARHEAGMFQQGRARYAKFAYSSRYGFSLAGDDQMVHQLAPDSVLALSEGHGPLRTRVNTSAWTLTDDEVLWLEWQPWPDVSIRTVLWPSAEWHARIHRIETGRSLSATEGGFAIGFGGSGAIAGETERRVEPHTATVRTPTDQSTAIDPRGERGAMILAPLPNTNVFASRTLLPVLTCELEPGGHLLVGQYHAGPRVAAAPGDPPPIPEHVWKIAGDSA